MVTKNKSVTICIGGDLFIKDKYQIIDDSLILKNSDFGILNLETPLGKGKIESFIANKSGPNLIQDSKIIRDMLLSQNIKYVVGANNHIFDYGVRGINETINYLDHNNIKHTGFGKNITEAKKPMLLENTNFCVLSTGEEEFGVASKNIPGYLSIYDDDIFEVIRSLKKSGKLVIVCPHGGGEEVPLPSKYIRDRYHKLVDVGADLVVSHHPHVPQGYENYKGKYIFYSLGNFIHNSYKKSWGLLVKVQITKTKIDKIDLLSVNVISRKAIIKELSKEQRAYLDHINLIISSKSRYKLVLRIQSVDMYQNYYNKYIERILVPKRKGLFVQKDNRNIVNDRELLFMNLIRNRSHSEFIERALQVLYFEPNYLKDERGRADYSQLNNYIKKHFQ